MAFVPVTPHVPSSSPSSKTLELAGRLTHLIREFEHDHPDVSKREVLQAVRLASQATGGGLARPQVVLAVVGGVLLATGVAAFLAASGTTVQGGAFPALAVIVTLGVLAVLAVLVARRSP